MKWMCALYSIYSWAYGLSLRSFVAVNTVVGFEVFTAVVMKSIIFWDMMPCSTLSCTQRFGGACLPAACSLVCWTNSSTLKMEAIRSSETSGATQRTTWRHIPKDDTLNTVVFGKPVCCTKFRDFLTWFCFAHVLSNFLFFCGCSTFWLPFLCPVQTLYVFTSVWIDFRTRSNIIDWIFK
jgi:hypothetical protein